METKPNHNNPFEDAPIIYRYTREQALEDGVLVDLTSWASETGFRVPVACTHGVWADHIVPPAGTLELGQSERGRAHDVLWMLYLAIKRSPPGQTELRFEVIFLNKQLNHETVTLKAVCGPGDAGDPVITVMLPHED
jgi:fermentation-respiration switch protein FrsA (DUF1100 family)